MKWHLFKPILCVGLLILPAAETYAAAQATTHHVQHARARRRGSASRRIGTGAIGGAAIGGIAGRGMRGAMIGGGIGAGAGALHNRRQRRRGR